MSRPIPTLASDLDLLVRGSEFVKVHEKVTKVNLDFQIFPRI
jgi:hypothetical protein